MDRYRLVLGGQVSSSGDSSGNGNSSWSGYIANRLVLAGRGCSSCQASSSRVWLF